MYIMQYLEMFYRLQVCERLEQSKNNECLRVNNNKKQNSVLSDYFQTE